VPTSPDYLKADISVLVVDDDEEARFLLDWILCKAGFRVVQTGSGEDAIDLVQAGKLQIHLAIIDYNMHGMDGIQTFLGLRHLRPGLKAILYTGNPDIDQLRQKCPAGLICLNKDFEREKLLSLIADLLA
jgi:DNA-binding NtrC family response regulator